MIRLPEGLSVPDVPGLQRNAPVLGIGKRTVSRTLTTLPSLVTGTPDAPVRNILRDRYGVEVRDPTCCSCVV